mgnify:CR=1 FL=1
MSNLATKRIIADIKNIKRTELEKQNIHVFVEDDDIFRMKALIIGPEDTPYENGYYFIDIHIGDNYPFQNPKCEFIIDLEQQFVEIPSIGFHIDFEINSYKKTCLINGYDDIDYLINNKNKIEEFERKKNA